MINFKSKLHSALFGYYFANDGTRHYVRELSRLLSFSAAPLSRELNALSRHGIFISSRSGREKYFYINKHHPLYNELRKITEYIVAKKATTKNKSK